MKMITLNPGHPAIGSYPLTIDVPKGLKEYIKETQKLQLMNIDVTIYGPHVVGRNIYYSYWRYAGAGIGYYKEFTEYCFAVEISQSEKLNHPKDTI